MSALFRKPNRRPPSSGNAQTGNTFQGDFTQAEKDLLNTLVTNWTFWEQNGHYYARCPHTPDKRFVATNVSLDLAMQITIAQNAGKL